MMPEGNPINRTPENREQRRNYFFKIEKLHKEIIKVGPNEYGYPSWKYWNSRQSKYQPINFKGFDQKWI
jgi:hypothetical protein